VRLPRILPVLTLGALCVVDWRWTVAHLERGTAEANPLLAWAYEAGELPAFSLAKLGATAFGLAVLAWHRHHPLARALVPVAIAVYGLVLVAHGVAESSY
jgi:hypothetical protein